MTTKFMFLRDSKRNPVACIATNFNKETNKFTYQYSVVHPDDQFNKDRGRQIAEGRLRSNPIELINEQDANKQWKGSHYAKCDPFQIFGEHYKCRYFNEQNLSVKLDNKSNMESIIIWLANNTNSPTKLKNAAKVWLSNKHKLETNS